MAKFAHFKEGLDLLRAHGADPSALKFDEIISPTEGVLNGRRTILLGTNNYLGLTFDQHCIEASVEVLRAQGTGTTGSRMAGGSYAGHRDLERRLAKFYGRKECMVFSTGYQANLGLLSTVAGRGDHLLIDADSHASIYDGCRLGHAEVFPFRHNDADHLYKRLRRLNDQPGDKIIVVEGIYSMLGDTAPLKEIAAVKRETGAYLVVDEAHSMGVLGENGRGLAEEVGVEDDVDFVVGTFSKSLGSVGGFCVSDIDDFNLLRLACRPYMFTASLPPAVIASTIEALNQMQARPDLRAKLMSNGKRLYDGLNALGFTTGPQPNPVVAIEIPDRGLAIAFWNALLTAGLYVNLAGLVATPKGTPLLRCSVSAAHSEAQIDIAIELFAEVGRQLGVLAEAPKRLSA